MLLALVLNAALIGDSLTVTGFGVTLHGQKPGAAARVVMDNKLTDNGRLAMNPQLGAIYKTKDWQFAGIAFQDCFGNPAGMLLAGPKIDLGDYFSVGAVVGIYGRKSIDKRVEVKESAEQTKFLYPEDLPLSVHAGAVELAPVAAVTASATLPINNHWGIETNAAFNFYLNHVNTGLKYSW